jgi:hypothetical protein
MKSIITLLFIVFAFGVTAQNYTANADLVIIDKSGQSFYLIIDGVAQNAVPKTQLKIVGVTAAFHELKLLYANGVNVNLQHNVTLELYKQHTAFVTWRKGRKRLEWIEITGVNQSHYGGNFEVIMFTPSYIEVCYLCKNPSAPGFHYHPDGSIHNNYGMNGGNNAGNQGGYYPPNGNNNGNNQGNQGGYYPPNGNNQQGNTNCQYPLPTIKPILDEMNNISFSDKKMEYAKDALANKCITSDQAYQIVEAFTFDDDRVKMAKYCYNRMSDQIYANKLLDLFKFSSSRNEVRKYFTR